MSSAKSRAFDQRVEIDAGFDAHLVAEKHQILGADIAGGAGMAGERTAAEPGDRGVEARHAHFEPGIGIGDRHAAGVVQMQRDIEIGPALAQRADDALDGERRRPGHGVGERDVVERDAMLARDVEDLLHQDRRRAPPECRLRNCSRTPP